MLFNGRHVYQADVNWQSKREMYLEKICFHFSYIIFIYEKLQ